MNKLTLSVIGALVVVLGFLGYGYFHSPKLSSYNPPVQSSSGFSQSIATSTTLAASSLCAPTSIQFLGLATNTTTTIAAATSTYAACPLLNPFGAISMGTFVNDSTNTVAIAGGTGDVFKCETQGVGTSTVVGGCTASGFSILASSTVNYTAFFDSASTTLTVLVGNNYK